MSETTLTLYTDSQLISPYVMSAFVSLAEKGLSFNLKKINLATKENHRLDYSRISASRRVPTLTQGEFYLSESSAISEYLEEIFPPSQYARLYPTDSQAKAKAREIQAWLRSDLMPIRAERPTEVIYFDSINVPLSGAALAAVEKLFAAVEPLLENSVNLFGEWCIADTDLAIMLNRLVANGDQVPERLAAYVRHQWQRASVQSWVSIARETG